MTPFPLQQAEQLLQVPVTTPDGVSGPWAIESFYVTHEEALANNYAMWLTGHKKTYMICGGHYKRLVHAQRGVIMSNTPMEVATNLEFMTAAHGNVLINGLGLGMVLHVILGKDSVSTVTVVERDADVLALTAPHFQRYVDSGVLRIVHSDCFEFSPPPGAHYDVVWHDIWDTISSENVAEMDRLREKYADISRVQLCWTEKECIAIQSVELALLHLAGKTMEDFERWLARKGEVQ